MSVMIIFGSPCIPRQPCARLSGHRRQAPYKTAIIALWGPCLPRAHTLGGPACLSQAFGGTRATRRPWPPGPEQPRLEHVWPSQKAAAALSCTPRHSDWSSGAASRHPHRQSAGSTPAGRSVHQLQFLHASDAQCAARRARMVPGWLHLVHAASCMTLCGPATPLLVQPYPCLGSRSNETCAQTRNTSMTDCQACQGRAAAVGAPPTRRAAPHGTGRKARV